MSAPTDLTQLYQQLYAYREPRGTLGVLNPFAQVSTTIFFQSPVGETDSSGRPDAYSLQQNVCGRDYWYQNVVETFMEGGVVKDLWIPQEWTVPPTAAKMLSYYGGAPIEHYDLSTGQYAMLFVMEDTGTKIRDTVMVLDQKTGEFVFQLKNPDQSIFFHEFPDYSPLNVVSMAITGMGGFSTATFSQGNFVISHNLRDTLQSEATDVMMDGSTMDFPPSHLPIIPGLNQGTAESENLAYWKILTQSPVARIGATIRP